MLGAQEWRSALAARLLKVGQDIVITRVNADGSRLSVTCRAFVRRNNAQEASIGLQPAQLHTPVAQNDWLIVITGNELDAAGWPSLDGLPLPKRNDLVTIETTDRSIQLVTPILVNGDLVRIEITARG